MFQTVAPQPKELSKLLKWAVHTLEIFCWEQDFCDPFDTELDEPEPVTWCVHVEYSNGEIQDTESANGIPDRLDELLFSLSDVLNRRIICDIITEKFSHGRTANG